MATDRQEDAVSPSNHPRDLFRAIGGSNVTNIGGWYAIYAVVRENNAAGYTWR